MYVFQTFHELLTRICALYQLPSRAMRMGEEGEREGEGEGEGGRKRRGGSEEEAWRRRKGQGGKSAKTPRHL